MFRRKRLFIHLLVIFMAFSFTSCFHIIEDIFFQKDGSGTYSITVDMSQIADMMAAMGTGDDKEMNEAMSGMVSEFEMVKKRLEALGGVSNVKQEVDKEMLVFSVSFDFDDLKALNLGMSEYFMDRQGGQSETHTFFTYSKGKLVRSDKDLMSEALLEATQGEDDQGIDPAVMFSDVYFKTKLRFARGYRAFSNKEYQSEDENTLTWKKYLFNPKDKDKKVNISVTTRF